MCDKCMFLAAICLYNTILDSCFYLYSTFYSDNFSNIYLARQHNFDYLLASPAGPPCSFAAHLDLK